MSRILIIDDEPSSRVILQSRLKDAGHDVTLAESGAQGLGAAREGAFDLLVVDDALGSGVDSVEVVRRLQSSPETGNVPVVVVSRQPPQRDMLQKIWAAGCAAYLTKPENAVLEDVIRTVLRRRALHDDLLRQARALEAELRRLQDAGGPPATGRERVAGDLTEALREVGSGAPDGLVVVDGEGVVRRADRGAHEILGNRIEGRHLGRLAPGTGLEAFVRDAHTEPRSGFRLEIHSHDGHVQRSLLASVVPLVAPPGEVDPGLRVLAIADVGRRRLLAELVRLQEARSGLGELALLRELARAFAGPASLVGVSQGMQQLRSLFSNEIFLSSSVLIYGPAGVGKKHLARAIHYSGPRSGSLQLVHCGRLGAEQLERELFGCTRGAAGAVSDLPGAFQMADRGTLVLEAVEELPSELQERVLEAIRTRKVRRVGSKKAEPAEAQVLATTTIDLEGRVAEGRFERELLDALAAYPVEIEALAQRPLDIPVLAQHFLERYGSSRGELEIDDEAMLALEQYDWPGNVRELESCIERACAECSGPVIGIEALPAPLRELHERLESKQLTPQPRQRVALGGTHTSPGYNGPPAHLGRPVREYDITDDDPPSFDVYECKLLMRALDLTGGDKLKAAKLLGVGKSTLYRKLKRHGLS